MKQIHIHKFSGVLSAFGIGLADVVSEKLEHCLKTYAKDNFEYIGAKLMELKKKAITELVTKGFEEKKIRTICYLNMRYAKTDYSIMIHLHEKENEHVVTETNFKSAFEAHYKREYGFILPERDIIVDDLRVRGIAESDSLKISKIERMFAILFLFF